MTKLVGTSGPERSVEPNSEGETSALLYLDLLKRSLSGLISQDPGIVAGFEEPQPFDSDRRRGGEDWPVTAETMIGMARLDNLQECVTDVIRRGLRGDLIETGVWRGGATILMRGVLKAYGDTSRIVWAADSFEGVPRPDPEAFPADGDNMFWTKRELAVSLEQVRANFDKYGLLDEQVRFLPGWFRDTLPTAPIERLAVLRLDGDLYESTIIALRSLYPKLSPDGFVIIDDYALETCRAAVDDYREENGIGEEPVWIDRNGVFWKKTGA